MSSLVSVSAPQGSAKLIHHIKELNRRYSEAAAKSDGYVKGTEYRSLNKEQLMRERVGLKERLETIEKRLMMQRRTAVDKLAEDQETVEQELEQCIVRFACSD